jgi:hypothetical protein
MMKSQQSLLQLVTTRLEQLVLMLQGYCQCGQSPRKEVVMTGWFQLLALIPWWMMTLLLLLQLLLLLLLLLLHHFHRLQKYRNTN